MKVLVTGGAGFIGHHIVDRILKYSEWDITILDRLDCSGNLNRLAEIGAAKNPRVRFVYYDLKAPFNAQLTKQIGYHEYILHLAAATHVDRSMRYPYEFVMDNVVGTCNILDFAREVGCKKFINFSTDEVFGPALGTTVHKEEEPYKPSNPYAAAKCGAASLGYSYFISYGLPVITTYTMNNYGERQLPEKLIPRAIKSILDNSEMPIFAKLDENKNLIATGTRYWLYTRATASALSKLLQDGVPGESYNIIGFDERTNIEIVELIGKIMNKTPRVKLVNFYDVRPGHDVRYALDGTKLSNLGWKPEFSFEESLERVVKFTLDNPWWAA